MGKSQREYFLREQMKAIQRELGEADPKAQEQEEYDEKIAAAQMPDEVEKKAREELGRLERMHPESAEAGVIRTYLDTLCALPWAIESPDEVSIDNARGASWTRTTTACRKSSSACWNSSACTRSRRA